MENYFILNNETRKLELHFNKADYDALTDEQRAAIKSSFVWGRRSGCWISRAMVPHLYTAKRVAAEIGLTDAGETGEKLSFSERMEAKAEKAERRAERLEAAAERAERKGDDLTAPINSMHGDIAFFTQPNINTSAGRAFTRRRERMWASFGRGMEEYKKSEDYRQRAEIARKNARGTAEKDPGFIMRRIAEREADIRALQRTIDEYAPIIAAFEAGETPRDHFGRELTDREAVEKNAARYMDRLEEKLDELAYYEAALEAAGGVKYPRELLKVGDIIKTGTHNFTGKVISLGPKNAKITEEIGGVCFTFAIAYADIASATRDGEPIAPAASAEPAEAAQDAPEATPDEIPETAQEPAEAAQDAPEATPDEIPEAAREPAEAAQDAPEATPDEIPEATQDTAEDARDAPETVPDEIPEDEPAETPAPVVIPDYSKVPDGFQLPLGFPDFCSALAAAKAAALAESEHEDGGTCNFDAPMMSADEIDGATLAAALATVSLSCWETKIFKQKFYVISGCFDGQANRRSAMAEAFIKSMSAQGWEISEYCQMD